MEAVNFTQWLQFHALVSAGLGVILFLVYFRLDRKAFLKYWALGWLAMAVHDAGTLLASTPSAGHFTAVAATVTSVIAAYLEGSFMALAGLAVRPKPAGRNVRAAVFALPFALALAGLVQSGALQAVTLDQASNVALWRMIAPRELLSAAALLFFAWMFSAYHPGAKSTAGVVTGCFCMLHAAHHMAFALTAEGLPIYSSVASPSVIAIETVLIFGLTLGLIASVVEDAQLAWREAESLWAASTEGMLLVSTAGRVLRANSAYCRLVARPCSEIVGRLASDLYSLEPGGPADGAGRRSVLLWNGARLWLDISSTQVVTRSGRAVFSIFRDVTRQVETEAALERSRQRMMLAFESTDDAVFDWNVASGELFLAPKLLELLGYEAVEIGGRGVDYIGLCVPEDAAKVNAALVQALKTPGARFEVEHRLLARSGAPVWVLARGSVVERSADGRALRVAGTLRDVSERRRTEQERERLRLELIQAQKLEAIGRLASGVAHDFNNLLTVILGYSEAVLGSPGDTPLVVDCVREIREAGERASHLTSRLLAFSRKQVSQPRALDLNDVVRDSEKMLRRIIGEDIAVNYSYAEDLRPVVADPREIDQVLLNLAVNARDAMPDGGSLDLRTGSRYLSNPETLRRLSLKPGEYVTLSVIDSGHGMDEETRARIFEPFFTTKEAGKGTGLGLSTVYWIVTQNGGGIDVLSAPGRGATFTVYLPAATTGVLESELPPETQESVGSETVLLVEDQDDVRRVLVNMLRSFGYSVIAASGGEDAMQAVAKHARLIDVLVTDVVMGDCRGPDLAETISSLQPQIKTLFMSGYATADVAGRVASAPYIQKPFTADQLAGRIRQLLAPVEEAEDVRAAGA